jgi:hypothetical protein
MNLLSLAIFLFSAAAAGSPLRNPFEEALSKRQTQYMNACRLIWDTASIKAPLILPSESTRGKGNMRPTAGTEHPQQG